MAIFAVIGLDDATDLANTVQERFPRNHYTLEPGVWLVAADGLTAKDVAFRPGLTKENGILGVVITVGGYNGLAPADIWEWLNVKATKANA